MVRRRVDVQVTACPRSEIRVLLTTFRSLFIYVPTYFSACLWVCALPRTGISPTQPLIPDRHKPNPATHPGQAQAHPPPLPDGHKARPYMSSNPRTSP